MFATQENVEFTCPETVQGKIELAAGEIRHVQMIEKLQQMFRCLDEKWKPEELSQKLVETLLSL